MFRINWIVLITIAVLVVGCVSSDGAPRQAFITTGDGGWEWVFNSPQSVADFSLLFFVNRNLGWEVNAGRILKTTNGGRTWSTPKSGISGEDLMTSAFFTDAKHGWIVSTGYRAGIEVTERTGVILKTTDGGVTWTRNGPEKGVALQSVWFADQNTGWTVGTDYKDFKQQCAVFKTTDAGDTWSRVYCGVSDQPWHVQFADRNTGWILCSSSVLRTTDGGKTWTSTKPAQKTSLRDMCFVDSNNGWVSGSPSFIAHTSDGGQTWTEQKRGTGGGGWTVTDICFVDTKNGWAANNSGNRTGTMLQTSDGGKTWNEQQCGSKDFISAVYFHDANDGMAVGGEGVTYLTTDGGKTWASDNFGGLRWVGGVDFIDTKMGWIVGTGGAIYKSEDGGVSWTQQRQATFGDQLDGVCFMDTNTGWAVGWKGMIVATTDGGKTWRSQQSGVEGEAEPMATLMRVRFLDAKNGWIVGSRGKSPNIETILLKTVNGGADWVKLSTGTMTRITDVWFADSKTGWEVGDKGLIYKTVDGGKTWARQPSGVTSWLNRVAFKNTSEGWVVGSKGTILKTEDGGKTWSKKVSGATDWLGGIAFVDDKTGWMGGEHLVMTTDGGEAWRLQEPGARSYDICFVDKDHGWIPRLQVLRTTTAGLPGCVWAQQQNDGKEANFGHLVVTKKDAAGIYAEHPDSRIGIRVNIKGSTPNIGDYIYVHGKIRKDGSKRVIDADSIDIITAGWGELPRVSN